MLILSRKKGQSIMINQDIEIFVSAIEGDQVKIGVNAPPKVKIYRKELIEAIEKSNREAIAFASNLDMLRKMMNLEDS